MRSDAVDLRGWPGEDAVTSRLVARISLANGETCWLVAHDQVTHPDNCRTIDEFKSSIETKRLSLHDAADWSSIPGIILAVDTKSGTRKSVEVRLSD